MKALESRLDLSAADRDAMRRAGVDPRYADCNSVDEAATVREKLEALGDPKQQPKPAAGNDLFTPPEFGPSDADLEHLSRNDMFSAKMLAWRERDVEGWTTTVNAIRARDKRRTALASQVAEARSRNRVSDADAAQIRALGLDPKYADVDNADGLAALRGR